MTFNPDELRRHYESLSDQALLDIDPAELTPLANQVLEAELDARGLLEEPEEPAEPESQSIETPDVEPPAELSKDQLVAIATYTSASEARLALALLRSAGIASGLDQATGSPEVQLFVPSSLAEQALAVLNDEITEEELAAQAEAAGDVEEEGEEEKA